MRPAVIVTTALLAFCLFGGTMAFFQTRVFREGCEAAGGHVVSNGGIGEARVCADSQRRIVELGAWGERGEG